MTNHLKDNFNISPLLVAIYSLPIEEQVSPMILFGKLGEG
jgi:hypothetical protein